MGRKQLTTDNLVDGWRELILSMMEEGCSEKEVMVACLGNSFYAWKRLQENDVEFQRIISFGKILAQAWWEKMGRENLTARYFQTGLWSMNMKNRFGWTDRQSVQHEVGDSLYEKFRETNTQKLKDEARELLKRYGTGSLDRINADIAGTLISATSKSN